MNDTLLEQLKDYFKSTSKEHVQKDWDSTKKYDQLGPTVLDYQELTKKANKLFEEFNSEDFDAWDDLD